MKARISPNPAASAAARFSLGSSSNGAPSEKSRGRIVLRYREQPRRVYYASAFGTNKKVSAIPTAKERKPMQSQAQRLIPLFRTIVLSGVTAVLIPSAVLPMSAQNSVPATASSGSKNAAVRVAAPSNWSTGIAIEPDTCSPRVSAGRHYLRQRSHQRHSRGLDDQLRLCRQRQLYGRPSHQRQRDDFRGLAISGRRA